MANDNETTFKLCCPTCGRTMDGGFCLHCWTVHPQPMTYPVTVPPVCTGTGTVDADFTPIRGGLPSHGRCGICGQKVRLYDAQHLVTHPYLLPEMKGYQAPSP